MGNQLTEEYTAATRKNAEDLHEKLKQSVRPSVLESMPMPGSPISGDFYVEAVGTVIHFENGISDDIYNLDGIMRRDIVLDRIKNSRQEFLVALAAQLPANSSLLNIGAGGDTLPISIMQDAGHMVLSTDISKEVVTELERRSSSPAFACDLVHLSEVLPGPLDFVIGNSALGYVHPIKLRSIVKSVYEAMDSGGVFTFDVTPNPNYFGIAQGKKVQTVVNESGADPRELLSYIKQYGVPNGINAMAYFAYYRGMSVNLAVVEVLRRLFEQRGARCSSGVVNLKNTNGAGQNALTLRVVKAEKSLNILEHIRGERSYESPSDEFQKEIKGQSPAYILEYVDRGSGEELAKAIGIHRDRLSDPWLVARYIAEHQDSKELPDNIRDEVLAEIDPNLFVERIWACVDGKEPFSIAKPLPTAIALDQAWHKAVISGQTDWAVEQVDALIDEAYKKQSVLPKAILKGELSAEDKRKERNRQKAARRKQRYPKR